jgi:hypothetical protein
VAENEQVRIEIAFEGGLIVSAVVSPSSADALDSALGAAGHSSVVLDAADGRYTVAVPKVAYVKRFVRESRVGFGAG